MHIPQSMPPLRQVGATLHYASGSASLADTERPCCSASHSSSSGRPAGWMKGMALRRGGRLQRHTTPHHTTKNGAEVKMHGAITTARARKERYLSTCATTPGLHARPVACVCACMHACVHARACVCEGVQKRDGVAGSTAAGLASAPGRQAALMPSQVTPTTRTGSRLMYKHLLPNA